MRSPIVLVILLGFIGSFSVQASLKMKAMGKERRKKEKKRELAPNIDSKRHFCCRRVT